LTKSLTQATLRFQLKSGHLAQAGNPHSRVFFWRITAFRHALMSITAVVG
jgi:hypothetical protein